MRTKQHGMTIVTTSLAILVITIVLVLTITKTKTVVMNIISKQELQVFTSELFVSSNIHFFIEVNSSGSCFTVAPPQITGNSLIALGLLDPKWSTQSFFNPNLATVSYRSGSATGRIDTIDLVIPLNEPSSQDFYQIAHFTFSDANEIRFSKKIDFSIGGKSALHLDSNFCFG